MMVNFKSALPMPWISGVFLLALATIYLDLAKGQTTDAVCNGTDWNWAFNSKTQNPCLVAAYLLAPCGGGQYKVPALLPHQHYTPPNETTASNCLCSSVVYSLLSACGVCQMDKPIAEADPPPKWSSWNIDCPGPMVSISKYPNNISLTTAVPAWAYLDVVTADRFDPVIASRAVNLPESTVGNIEIPSSTPPLISPTSSSNSSGTSMVIIICVTVGGMIGLILTAILIVYLVKKRKRSAKMSATPSMAAATGFPSASQHPNTLLSGGHSNSNPGQSETPLPSPWSPPPPSSTPVRTISPMSAQSLLSTHNYGGLWGRGSDGMDYYHSPSVPGTVDPSENPGSSISMGSTIPLMQYAGTNAPPLDTPTYGLNANTRPVHAYGAGNGQGGSGPSQPHLSRGPEM